MSELGLCLSVRVPGPELPPSRLDQCLSWWQDFREQDDALMKSIRSRDLFHRVRVVVLARFLQTLSEYKTG